MYDDEDVKTIRKILKGDLRAFEKLVVKYQRPIYNGAYRMLNQHEDAEDVTQSVFLKAFENLNSYDPRYKFFSWLYRILINESINFLKHRSIADETDADAVPEIEDKHDRQGQIELEKDIQEALMELSSDYRSVIVLNHFQGFSYNEMSTILHIPEKTVKSRLFTARHLLKDILLHKGFRLHGG